ncbi:DNA/RNA helicase, superfamily II, SNF2 family protein [Nitzschia inconspicua]|uniref:DNA/RNA helicase, superfamily II, SNF2 family protein n=1 Tax=Nitzschia inconspicua TaxID=303405 RepID=A0A9K3LWB5_9STRA|nr:DNA/RNA helicase, superfamily II, SNF2 family protein [Nitzschia inconspicua]
MNHEAQIKPSGDTLIDATDDAAQPIHGRPPQSLGDDAIPITAGDENAVSMLPSDISQAIGPLNLQEKSTDVRGKKNETAVNRPKNNNGTNAGKKRQSSKQQQQRPQHNFTGSSLLTPNFVPKKYRAINEAYVTCIIPTLEPPKSETETKRVFQGLTGIPIPCQCSGKDCHALPANVPVTEEYIFAERQAKKRNGAAIPPINMPAGRDAYIQTFRELMQLEYAEKHRLYERYSQYEIKITTRLLPIPKKATNAPIETDMVAKFRIPGIADGRPSLKPGDFVFIRPHDMVPNPYNIKQFYPEPSPQNAPPPVIIDRDAAFIPFHRAEIHSRVISVTRGKPVDDEELRKDLVMVSWGIDPLFATTFWSQARKSLFTVRFAPSTSSHERALTAFRWLGTLHPTIARDLLFPTETPKLPPSAPLNENDNGYDSLEFEYMQLNENQSKFVQMMMTRTANPITEKIRPPMVLTGPAGTGKTKTLLAAILQCMNIVSSSERKEPHILVCTPSHTACDVITIRLAKLLSKLHSSSNSEQPPGQPLDLRSVVFRLYDVTRAVQTVPAEVLPFTRQDYSGQFVLPATQELLKFRVIVTTCEDAHLLFMAGITNDRLRSRRQCIQKTLESTMKMAGLHGTISGHAQPHFTHLFIDEAAQATEPESLIPLSVVVDDSPDAIKIEIALCGDPRQLSPNIYSNVASEILQRSLLERLLRLPVDTYGGGRETLLGPPTRDNWQTLDELIEYSFQKDDCHDHLSVFLNQSYRGHPSFLIMPSKLFYFDKLKSVVKNLSGSSANTVWLEAARCLETLAPKAYPALQPHVPRNWPMLFRGVKGNDASMAVESFFGSNSWCNRMEATVVAEMIEELVKNQGISTSSIGVMAAFRAQVVLIRRLLRDRNLGAVNVGIPEDYQSVERDIIMLSLTRSSVDLVEADKDRRAGLFHQPKRTNVALTRAEHLLVVVGNPDTMIEDPVWRDWLDFCRLNGLWYGDEETPKIAK